MTPAAAIYFHGLDAYIRSDSESHGLLMGEGPVTVVRDVASKPLELGQAVYEAFSRSRTGVPRPQDFRGRMDQYLALSGVKSWSKFEAKATLLHVRTVDAMLRCGLLRSAGKSGGMEPFGMKKLDLPPGLVPEVLGRALLDYLRQVAAT